MLTLNQRLMSVSGADWLINGTETATRQDEGFYSLNGRVSCAFIALSSVIISVAMPILCAIMLLLDVFLITPIGFITLLVTGKGVDVALTVCGSDLAENVLVYITGIIAAPLLYPLAACRAASGAVLHPALFLHT